MGNFKLFLVVSGIAAFVSPVFYMTTKYNSEKELNFQLNEVLNETLQEKEQLQKYGFEIEQKLQESQNKLDRLKDAQRMKESLDSAQQMIGEFNSELAQLTKERSELAAANASLNARLENMNKELIRTLDQLKLSKQEASRLESGGQAGVLRKKVEDLTRLQETRDSELGRLKEDLANLQKTNQGLIQDNKDLEMNLKEIEQKGSALQARATDLNVDISGQNIPVRELQRSVNQLKISLSDKEDQIRQLEAELAGVSSAKVSARNNREFLNKISDLENQLEMAKNEVERLKNRKESSQTGASYDNTREQIARLSELMVKKELELETAKRESLDAKEKTANLQTKITRLESDLSSNRTDGERVNLLQREKITLESRLSELQGTVSKKNELVDSLQKNLEYLTQQLARKDEEVRSIETRLAKSDTGTKEELEKQKSRYEEINLLYNSLRTQVSQFSDALNQRESDIEQKRREIASLKEEMASLKSRYEILNEELAEARQRQRKTLDDLVAAVKLNSIMQEKITGVSVSPAVKAIATEDQRKADELRRKIEVILEPQR
jgi:chromosome segregation ATPase